MWYIIPYFCIIKHTFLRNHFFFKKDIFQTLIHLSFDEGLLQSKSWTTEMVSHASSGEYLVHPQQLNIDFSKNLIHVTVNVFFHQPAFPIWRLVNWITLIFFKPSSYIPTDQRKTISSTDNCIRRFAVGDVHRLSEKTGYPSGGGEKVTCAKWGVW